MKNRRRYLKWLFTLCIPALIVSCNATRKIPAGDALYTGATVKIEDNEVSRQEKKQLQEDLDGLTRPKPNTKLLGLRLKLFFWNMGSDSSKFGRFIRKLGEPPVLVSDVNLSKNAQLLTNNLENKGFFHAKTLADTSLRNKKSHATYTVTTNAQYKIKDVIFVSDSNSVLQSAVNATQEKTFLKSGQPFNLDLIKGERLRIDAVLKEQGFYYFNPDYILVNVDSTIGDKKVNLYVQIKSTTPPIARVPYTINDVFIFSNYRLNTANTDTLKSQAVEYKGYKVVDRRKLFKLRMYDQAMQFRPGELYNRKDHNQSLNRLINLGVFKFVKNRFEPITDSLGKARLDAFYYLTPLPKKSLRFEAGGNTKSNNLTGSEIKISWKNRNSFREAELLTINASAGSEVQISGLYQGYNTYRLGAEAIFSIPRFAVPWLKLTTSNAYVPRTNIVIGYDILNRAKLYTLTGARFNFGYAWRENTRKEHVFYPISVNYVQPFNITKKYLDSSKIDLTLKNAVDTQFILGSNYSFTYDERIETPRQTGIYFNGTLDLSGNLAGVLSKAKPSGKKEIAGAAFAQYIKLETDSRYFFKVGYKNILATRIIAGIGFPYGNSRQIPFIKQFFIGGNNSIRAFRSRSIGPGSYDRGPIKAGTFLADQAGDIKLEFNTELRHKFSNVLEGAVFVDVGNIWLFNADTTRPGGKFTKDWSKELAVGTGVGVRLDFQILLLRVDIAFPLRDPARPDNRWIINQINIANSDWRKKNLVLNLAIGYPF